MRKRSKYRPKGVRLDAIEYVLTSITPLAALKSELATLRIRNHGALAAVCQGNAGKEDINTLIAAMNITEALVLQGVGSDYASDVRAGQDALHTMTRRGIELGDRFIFRAPELQAINLVMEIHDAQLDAITTRQLERAVDHVRQVVKSGGAKAI